MPIVESPSWDSWPASAPGERPEGNLVLVKIDPVASVAALEDEETTRAAAALPRHEWMLGLVVSSLGGMLDPNDKEKMSRQIDLFGQGPPDFKPIASLPVAPSPQLYDDRPPLEFHPRLPWPDLYLHTNCNSSVFISRINYGPDIFNVNLGKDEYRAIARRAIKDRCDWHQLPPATTPKPPIEVEPVGSGVSESIDTTSGSSAGSFISDVENDSPGVKEREDIGWKLAKVRIYAEIALDPATCPGPLGSPLQMEEPVRRIEELWTAWEERVMADILAKRPSTNAWIAGVEAARGDSEKEREPFSLDSESALDDNALFPEDSVDERTESDLDSDAALQEEELDDCLGRAQVDKSSRRVTLLSLSPFSPSDMIPRIPSIQAVLGYEPPRNVGRSEPQLPCAHDMYPCHEMTAAPNVRVPGEDAILAAYSGGQTTHSLEEGPQQDSAPRIFPQSKSLVAGDKATLSPGGKSPSKGYQMLIRAGISLAQRTVRRCQASSIAVVRATGRYSYSKE